MNTWISDYLSKYWRIQYKWAWRIWFLDKIRDKLPILFPVDKALHPSSNYTEKDLLMMEELVKMLMNFARNGNPTPAGSFSKWKPLIFLTTVTILQRYHFFSEKEIDVIIHQSIFGKKIDQEGFRKLSSSRAWSSIILKVVGQDFMWKHYRKGLLYLETNDI